MARVYTAAPIPPVSFAGPVSSDPALKPVDDTPAQVRVWLNRSPITRTGRLSGAARLARSTASRKGRLWPMKFCVRDTGGSWCFFPSLGKFFQALFDESTRWRLVSDFPRSQITIPSSPQVGLCLSILVYHERDNFAETSFRSPCWVEIRKVGSGVCNKYEFLARIFSSTVGHVKLIAVIGILKNVFNQGAVREAVLDLFTRRNVLRYRILTSASSLHSSTHTRTS